MKTLLNRLAMVAVLSCAAPAVWSEPTAPAVLGEQVEGSLLQAEEPVQFSPEEVTACGLDRGVLPMATQSSSLPPILVSLETGFYEQVPVVVREVVAAQPALSHRRRSLASRGAHQVGGVPSEVRETTVYRSVYRRQWKQVDLAPVIQKYAEKHNLDPWLLRGVIEVESAFRPYATSYAGAGGLMQLMPGTASYLGCRDRYDPEQNIAAGARYLRQMLNRFDNNYDLAIAAYNAGPGNVEKFGGIPPFAETQNYVRKVRRAWAWRPLN